MLFTLLSFPFVLFFFHSHLLDLTSINSFCTIILFSFFVSLLLILLVDYVYVLGFFICICICILYLWMMEYDLVAYLDGFDDADWFSLN